MTMDREFKAIVLRLLSMILYLIFWMTYKEIETFNSKARENYENVMVDATMLLARLGKE